MNCFRVQSLLSAYVDQELSTEDRRLLRNHLFNCSECSHEMESLVLIKDLMGRLSAPELPGDSLILVHEEIRGLTNNRFHSDRHSYIDARHILMTAACISLFLMTSTLIFPRMQSNSDIQAKKGNVNNVETSVIASTRESESISDAQAVSTDQQENKKRKNSPELFNRIEISPILSGTPVSR